MESPCWTERPTKLRPPTSLRFLPGIPLDPPLAGITTEVRTPLIYLNKARLSLMALGKNDLEASVAVVVPAYRSSKQILSVLGKIPDFVSNVFVVDDCCPDGTGQVVTKGVSDSRVQVTRNQENLGVGGATKVGFALALDHGADIIVKLDSDGQVDPSRILELITPILNGSADYTKGNRFFSLDHIQEMPRVRIVGNAILSLFSKISSGYWSVNDPTNGFVAVTSGALRNIDLQKVRNRWFFESDLLFRLYLIRAVVIDVPLRATYGDERSNLKVRKVIGEFLLRHNVNLLKRILYIYYLREWTASSILGPTGLVMLISGAFLGLSFLSESAARGVETTAGQVMISVLPLILGFQLLLTVLTSDIANEPSKPSYGVHTNRYE